MQFKIQSYVHCFVKVLLVQFNELHFRKTVWKIVKPLLSDESINSEKIYLNENGEVINSDSRTAEVLNEFFSNIVKSLKIP